MVVLSQIDKPPGDHSVQAAVVAHNALSADGEVIAIVVLPAPIIVRRASGDGVINNRHLKAIINIDAAVGKVADGVGRSRCPWAFCA